MNLSLYNIKFGPWLKGGWFRQLQETGEKLRQMQPNDPLLMHFWPEILKDRAFLLEDSQEGRKLFLATLRSQQFLTSKGPKASLSKFNAFSEAHRLLDEHWSSQAFVMTATCLLQGWVSYADQLWCPEECIGQLGEASTSRNTAKKEAKAALDKMRNASVNSLHSMTKYINDAEVKLESRLIAAVLAPESKAAAQMLVDMRGPEQTLAYFVSWAEGGWLETACEHLGLLEDLASLNRIGFHMQWTEVPGEGQLEYERATTENLFSFLKSLLKYRAGSNLWHTCGQGACAGLLSDEPALLQSRLLWFKEICEAEEEVKQTGNLAAQNLLKDSMLQEIFQQNVIRFLKEEGFARVAPKLEEVLQATFSSLLNTKLVEDANKFQREKEDRGNNSKTVSMAEAWHTVSQHKVLESYSREEVRASKNWRVPASWSIEDICRENVRRTENKTMAEKADFDFLSRVTGQVSWPSFTPETEQRLICNLALLVHIHKLGKKWDMAEKAWLSGLVQTGSVLQWQEKPHYVVRTYPQGLLLWPLLETGDNRLVFQKPLKKLVWGFVFSLEKCKIQLLTPCAPMEAVRGQKAGIQLVGGAWQPLLQNLMDSGFKGMNESQLKKLNCLLGHEEPEAQQENQEVALAVHLLVNEDPTLTEKDVLDRIEVRNTERDFPVEGMTEELADVIKDTLRVQDQEKIINNLKKKAAAPSKVAEWAKASYQKSYDKIPMEKVQAAILQKQKKEKESTQRKGSKRKEVENSEVEKKTQIRKYAKRDQDVDKQLHLHLPPDVACDTDDDNGRWRLTHKLKGAKRQKSLSWTMAGHSQAAAAALLQAFKWHKEQTGEDMPVKTQKLVDKWQNVSTSASRPQSSLVAPELSSSSKSRAP